jgi:hypothetical protein
MRIKFKHLLLKKKRHRDLRGGMKSAADMLEVPERLTNAIIASFMNTVTQKLHHRLKTRETDTRWATDVRKCSRT